jgi:hypothetical protein
MHTHDAIPIARINLDLNTARPYRIIRRMDHLSQPVCASSRPTRKVRVWIPIRH